MITPPETENFLEETVREHGRISSFLASLGIESAQAKMLLSVMLVVTFFSGTISFLLLPPFDFPQNKIITIKRGASLAEVSVNFSNENLIRSQALFEFCMKVVGGEKPIVAGDYYFKEPIPTCTISRRIAGGVSGIPSIKVTLPEGMSNTEMTVILSKSLEKFEKDVFIEKARSKEGYLFPDTYFFPTGVVAEGVEIIMSENFNKKIEPWKGPIESSGHTLRDIIIMASILEKEATSEEDKKMVAGILWKRIEIKMPLQVDATFMYLLGKKSSDLTQDDLKMNSAYNTYKNRGLPAGPIGNPGIVAIRSAIAPTTSPYLYYLSDNDGVIHYAKTFEEHKANKAKYIK
ncbi:MAG: endolytic transglycosylase MltG [bacterium]|nr:endolytic transglycosylase MltG [bacterium]